MPPLYGREMEVVLFAKDGRRLNKLKQRDISRRVLRALM